MTRNAIAILLAGSASAQPDMLVTVDNVAGSNWTVSAEFLTTPPTAGNVMIWADASFELVGDGSAITITSYNPAYDTTLGDAQVSNGPSATFQGNANFVFGTIDISDPLPVLEFTYGGAFDDLALSLVGQNSWISDFGSRGTILLYQDASGNPGTLTWGIRYIPAPATLALAPMTLVAARRRRK